MSLSKDQEDEMFKSSIETNMTLKEIKERLEKGDKTLYCHGKKLWALEKDNEVRNGKLGLIVLIMSLIFTGVLHAIGWVISHFWK
jgi:cytoskeletal protein RodZ